MMTQDIVEKFIRAVGSGMTRGATPKQRMDMFVRKNEVRFC